MSYSISRTNTGSLHAANNHVVAHRGAFKKKGFPENSIAALREAIRLQCAGSEFDVRMTADDSLVINHDPYYRGHEIEKTLYKDMVAMKLSNGETLPTLQEFLVAGLENNNHTQLVIEIKPSGVSKDRGRLIAEKVVKLVHEFKGEKMVCYISFDYEICKRILSIDREAITQYLNGDSTPEQLKADGIRGADYNWTVFKKNPDWIAQAKKNNIILNAWTVNSKEGMTWFLNRQFDFITTNEPEMLLEMVR